MYKAHDVAAFVINWCNSKHIDITNLKLQKLLYFIQGENYHVNHDRLIDENFYAWKLGPVIPEIYNEYSMYSSYSIPLQNDNNIISDRDKNIINIILKKYAPLSTWDLVDKTHAEDPWKYNYQIFGNRAIIPFESIESYYQGGN